MTNPTLTTNKLNKAPIDLRAPEFFQVRKGAWRLITLIFIDYTLLFLAWLLAVNYANQVDNHGYSTNNYLPIFIAIGIQIVALALQGIYKRGQKLHEYFNTIKALTVAHGLIAFIVFLYAPIVEPIRLQLLWSWVMSIAFISTSKLAINMTLEYLRKQKIFGHHAVFVICDSDENEKAVSSIRQEKSYLIRGIADSKALDRNNREVTLAKLKELEVTEVFISWNAIKNRMFVCWQFQASGITVHILPMELKPIDRDLEFTKVGGMNCLTFSCPLILGKDFLIKRIFDIAATTIFLIFSFPIYIAIAIAIKLDSPGPIFFKQTRVGLHGKSFKVWKFRTMRADAEKFQKELEAFNETKDGILFKIKDDPRVTRVGKFLRRYSLDELPQLFNVLLGEMSLIGPRPLPIRDVDKFSEHHFIRHEVLPGITGLWQVSGRSKIVDFEKVITLDLSYIENWSLRLDFEILLKTIQVVLTKDGAY